MFADQFREDPAIAFVPAHQRPHPVARLLYRDEFAMGGPQICAYLLPDGAVITNGGVENGFSPDGRYFVTLAPGPSHWMLIIYDLHAQLLHICDIGDAFRELEKVENSMIYGGAGAMGRDAVRGLPIAELLGQALRRKMIPVVDLKIPEDEWQRLCAPMSQPFPAPPVADGPRFDWRPYLPDSLIALEDPLAPLRHPMAEIIVAGEASGLLVDMRAESISWREDGHALLCEAQRRDGSGQGYWLWQVELGWRPLHPPRDLAKAVPYGAPQPEVRLDTRRVVRDWQFAQPELSEQSHGTLTSYIYAPLRIGRQSFEMPVVQQVIDLAAAVKTATSAGREYLQSAALQNGERLIWRFLRHDAGISRDIYECIWQGQALAGEWLLDHRLSGDGRYLALVAYAAAPAVPHRIAVIDSDSGALSWVEGRLYFPEIQGFSDRKLHIVDLTGRHAETDEPIDQAGQESGAAGAAAGLAMSVMRDKALSAGSAVRPDPEASRDWYLEDGDFRLQYACRTISWQGRVWRVD